MDSQRISTNVIAPAALAIHADSDAVAIEHPDGGRAGELAARIGVHDLRFPMAGNRVLKRFHAGIGRQADGYAPGEPPRRLA